MFCVVLAYKLDAKVFNYMCEGYWAPYVLPLSGKEVPAGIKGGCLVAAIGVAVGACVICTESAAGDGV